MTLQTSGLYVWVLLPVRQMEGFPKIDDKYKLLLLSKRKSNLSDGKKKIGTEGYIPVNEYLIHILWASYICL
jgi:hypothetical protein